VSAGCRPVKRAADNKGKRDEVAKLDPVVVEHLKKPAGFDLHVLPWNHNRRTLLSESGSRSWPRSSSPATGTTSTPGSATCTASMTSAARSRP
jgi:hypothetical protein